MSSDRTDPMVNREDFYCCRPPWEAASKSLANSGAAMTETKAFVEAVLRAYIFTRGTHKWDADLEHEVIVRITKINLVRNIGPNPRAFSNWPRSRANWEWALMPYSSEMMYWFAAMKEESTKIWYRELWDGEERAGRMRKAESFTLHCKSCSIGHVIDIWKRIPQ